MTRLANVLIVDIDAGGANVLGDRLKASGYALQHVVDVNAAMASVVKDPADLVIVGDLGDVDAVAVARDLKAKAIHPIPVLVLISADAPQLWRQAYEAGIDDLVAVDCGDTELIARLRPLVRLSTMHMELQQRVQIVRDMGLDVQPLAASPTDDAQPRVLLIGDNARQVEAALKNDATLTMTDDIFQAEDLLTRGDFDAAILGFSTEVEGLDGFCAQVRHNPRLFNLPLTVLDSAASEDLYRQGATRVLPWPCDFRILHPVVLGQVRHQQSRRRIRMALAETQIGPAREPVLGMYSRAFLDRYLSERVGSALGRDRHLSAGFLSAPAIDGIRQQYGEDAAIHLAQQIGHWITGLLRVEDMTAIYDTDEFLIVLPDTPLNEAEMVMHRIAGVLAYTDFAVREVYHPVKAWVQVGTTEVKPNDTPATLIARARQKMN